LVEDLKETNGPPRHSLTLKEFKKDYKGLNAIYFEPKKLYELFFKNEEE